jgi:hypothetical protein
MKKLIFVLAILVLYISGCLSGSGSYQTNYNFGGIDRIAIVAVDGQIENENAKHQISDLFVMELLNKGYAPIPLAQVESTIRSMADTDETLKVPQDAYAQIGEILKVPAVLVVSVPFFADEIFLSAKLIDTKDGSVLWMDQDFGTTGLQNSGLSRNPYGQNQEAYLMDPLLLQSAPPSVSNQKDAPGKTDSRPLTPREFQKMRNIVSKICISLPSNRAVAPAIRQKARSSSDW